MADDTSSNNDGTAKALGIAGAAGAAVGTAHVLYRPDSTTEKLADATKNLNEAAAKVNTKISDVVKEKGYTRYGEKLYTRAAEAQHAVEDAQLKIDGLKGGNNPRDLNKAYRQMSDARSRAADTSAALNHGFRDEIKPELAELKRQQKLYTSFSKMESANAKEGILAAVKRPVEILKHGSGKAKLAILGAAAAIGGAIYVGSRVAQGASESKAQMSSFAEREQMRQQAAAMADPNLRAV